jgi:tetratricopeptide (TPR) repeat protein
MNLYEAAGDDSTERAINLGVCAARLGHDLKAVAAYEQALELDPKHRAARLYLGNALLRLGRRDEAVEAYKAFLEQGNRGEAAERVRRILAQIAPGAVADTLDPLEPVKQPPTPPSEEDS